MIINYLLTDVSAKREPAITTDTQVGINNNITITDIQKEAQLKFIKVLFKFDAVYSGGKSEELGKIMINGFVAYVGNDIDKIYDTWVKSKNLDEDVSEEILQASLNISILEAMSLAKMLQLPSVLPLPRVEHNGRGQTEKGSAEKKVKSK